MDVDAAVSRFEERTRRKKADDTAVSYRNDVRDWVEWLDAPGQKEFDPNSRERKSKTFEEADTADLRIYLGQLADNGYAGGTLELRISAISTFYKEMRRIAEEPGDASPDVSNPAADLDISDWQVFKQGTKKEQEITGNPYLTPEQVDKLADNAPPPGLRNELIIRLLYQTGLRRGELAETRIEDVDTERRKINVRSTKTYLNREVYYQPNLDTLMTRWLDVERKALATAGSSFLFPTYKTERISGKQINRTVRKAAENAGIQKRMYDNADGREQQKVTAHILRHSFAVQSVKNGMDTRRLQQLMGHAKISTTERYLGFTGEDMRDAVRKYGAGSE